MSLHSGLRRHAKARPYFSGPATVESETRRRAQAWKRKQYTSAPESRIARTRVLTTDECLSLEACLTSSYKRKLRP